ncbi:MAG: hypothetical protein V3T58_06530 [Candidatus Hydrothermarchaeales archaeon]
MEGIEGPFTLYTSFSLQLRPSVGNIGIMRIAIDYPCISKSEGG